MVLHCLRLPRAKHGVTGRSGKVSEDLELAADSSHGRRPERVVSGRACPAPCWERPKAAILAVEHQFKVPLADWLPQLVGRVDLIEVHEEGLIALVDCKTSRGRLGPDDLLQPAGQLALYAAGVEELVRTIGKEVRVGSRR